MQLHEEGRLQASSNIRKGDHGEHQKPNRIPGGASRSLWHSTARAHLCIDQRQRYGARAAGASFHALLSPAHMIALHVLRIAARVKPDDI
eukprot:1161911-Pelagomonas_calceolata.AAC.5